MKSCHAPKSLPQILVELPPKLPAIQADGDRLGEALAQLLDNACKFTAPTGSVKIQARLRRARVGAVPELDSQSMLEVIVADTGRGIVPSHLEAIFNHFYQEESALRRNFGGTGIGLARARLIIQSLGGQIWADSAGQQQGSKFHFTVPVASNCE